jgi:hypothetical protein
MYGRAAVNLTGDIGTVCSGTAIVGSGCCAGGDSFSDGRTAVVMSSMTAVVSVVLAVMDVAMLW